MSQTARRILYLLIPLIAVAVVGIGDAVLYYTGHETISTAIRAVDDVAYCVPLLISLLWGFIVGGLFVHWFYYRDRGTP
jgi:uncharacterized membrane protein